MVPVEQDEDDNDTDDNPNPDDCDYKGPKSLRTNYGRKGYWSTETPNVVRRNPVRLRSVLSDSEVNLNNSKRPSLSKGTLCSHNQQIGGVAWTVNRIRKWSALAGPLRKKRKLGPSL